MLSETSALDRWDGPGARRAFWGVFAVCAVVAQVPIAAVTWLPLVDWGGHIELMDLAQRLDAPDVQARFVHRGWLGPNNATLLLARLLHGVVTPLTLARALVGLYLVALPAAAVAFCVAFGRSRWLALFAFPLAWNHMLNFGFLNFLIGLPLVFAVPAAARRALADGPRWLWGAVGLGLLAAFCAHFLVWLMALALVSYLALWRACPRHLGPLALASAPSLALAARWALDSARGAGSPDPAWQASMEMRVKPMEGMLLDLHHAGMRFVESSADEITAVALGLAWLWLLQARLPAAPPRPGGARAMLAAAELEIGLVVGLFVYFLLPENFGGVNVVAARCVPVLLLLAALTPRWGTRDVRALPAIAVVAAVALAHPLVMARSFRAFDAEITADLPAAIAALPDGVALRYRDDTCSDWNAHNPHVELCATLHLPRAIHAALHHGVTTRSFAGAPTATISWRPGAAVPLPAAHTPSDAPEYVLIRSATAPLDLQQHPAARPLYAAAQWWLYRLDPAPTRLSRGRQRGRSSRAPAPPNLGAALDALPFWRPLSLIAPPPRREPR